MSEIKLPLSKPRRQELLAQMLVERPFLTDEELSRQLGVSIQTIRLDRVGLGIPEVRERIKNVAEQKQEHVKSLAQADIVGELIDLELNTRALSLLTVTTEMVYAKTKIGRAHLLFAQANSLAIAMIDAEVAVTGIARVKYKRPVRVGERLFAQAEVIRVRGNRYTVVVKTKSESELVFKGNFMVFALPEYKGGELL